MAATETQEQALERHLRESVAALSGSGVDDVDLDRPVRGGTRLTGRMALALFDAMAASRNLDMAARYLRKEGPGVYTIGSAGHESNAAIAAALRPTDPALLHYRSGGFYCARAQQVPDSTPLPDILLGLVAAADQPISGGRHKVFGNHALAVIPQTSTIASHLPRAMGVGFAIERAQRIDVSPEWPADAIVACSFGDASLNHSTALGALNAAEYNVHQGLRMPVLFCCEDNGLGISVRTPSRLGRGRLVEIGPASALRARRADGHRRHLRRASEAAIESCRAVRAAPRSCTYVAVDCLGMPAATRRSAYRPIAEIEARPESTIRSKRRRRPDARGTGIADPRELLRQVDAVAADCSALAADAAVARGSRTIGDHRPIVAREPDASPRTRAGRTTRTRGGPCSAARRIAGGGSRRHSRSHQPRTARSLATHPEMLLFGEDVAQ